MAEYIERIELIEEMKRNSLKMFNSYYKGYVEAIKDVADFKKADVQPVDRWISVKDRLPNEGETVLIYAPRTQNQYYIAMFYTLRDEIKFAMNIYGMSYCWYAEDVTHWQPLPQPPQD